MTKGNDIIVDAQQMELLEFGKRDYSAYTKMLSNIEKGFSKASDAYVMIACNLWSINHNEYFRIDNFKSIADFALEKFELKKATVYNYIKVIDKFGEIVDGKPLGLKEQFKPFKCSQLINMLNFTPEQLEAVDPAWSVRKIIEYGKTSLVDSSTMDNSDNDYLLEDAEQDWNNATEAGVEVHMSLPEIESGKLNLLEFTDFSDIEKHKDKILNAFEFMKNDKDFKDKNVRLVIELVYD